MKKIDENLIAKTKEFLKELSKVQDSYYDELVKKLKLARNPRLEEYLWDYIFNDYEEKTFSDYLKRYGYNNLN